MCFSAGQNLGKSHAALLGALYLIYTKSPRLTPGATIVAKNSKASAAGLSPSATCESFALASGINRMSLNLATPPNLTQGPTLARSAPIEAFQKQICLPKLPA